MIASIRDMVRASLPKRPPSVAEAERSLAAERQAIADATTAVQAAERRVVEVTLAAAAADEVAAAHEALDAARVTLRRRKDTEGMLAAQLEEMRLRDAEKLREAALRRTDELLAERAKVGAEMEKLAAAMAEAMTRVHRLNAQILEAVPNRPADLPLLFNAQALQNVINLRLFALSAGVWTSGNVGLNTPGTAAELPSLEARLQAECEQLLSQYQVRKGLAA